MSQVKESNRPNSSQTDSDKFNSAFLLLGISNFLSREAKNLGKKRLGKPEIISQFSGSIIYDQPPTNLGLGTQIGIHLGPSTWKSYELYWNPICLGFLDTTPPTISELHQNMAKVENWLQSVAGSEDVV